MRTSCAVNSYHILQILFFFLHFFTGYEITITREHLTSQDILGFGGAFTDAAGINIKSLSNGTQYLLMKLENNKSFTLRPGL